MKDARCGLKATERLDFFVLQMKLRLSVFKG